MTDLLAIELLVLLALLRARAHPVVARHWWKLLAGGILACQAAALLLSGGPVPPHARRPVLGSRPVPAFEGALFIRPAGHRIISVAGRPVESLSVFEAALEGLPAGGVAPMRAMDPGPDAGARTVLLWASRLERKEGEAIGAAAVRALEASLPPERPLLALPPWGITAPLRGAAGLAGLFRGWALVPKQYYALEVAPHGVPGYLPFRLAALLASFAVSLLLLRALEKARGAGAGRAATAGALALTLLLEAAALFVFS